MVIMWFVYGWYVIGMWLVCGWYTGCDSTAWNLQLNLSVPREKSLLLCKFVK